MKRIVTIFDTTLRDGSQSPGVSLKPDEKVEIAHALARLNVDVIEAGFPVASPADFQACQKIAREIHGPAIAGLCRVIKGDIDACWEALKENPHPRIHTFIATSDAYLLTDWSSYGPGIEDIRSYVLEQAVEGVRYARSLCADVEFSAEDATGTPPQFLAEVVKAVIEAGASVINLPDTRGCCLPSHMAGIIGYIMQEVDNIDQAIISTHCHNDMGLAVANSLAALEAGAGQVEVAINGLGERAGNAALEQIAVILDSNRDNPQMSVGHNLDMKQIWPISQIVTRLSGVEPQPNCPIVGRNAFAHSSGIHQKRVLEDPNTYEGVAASRIGRDAGCIVLSDSSGRRAVKSVLKSNGLVLLDEDFAKVFGEFMKLATIKKIVSTEELVALASSVLGNDSGRYKLINCRVTSGDPTQITANATILDTKTNAERREVAGGNGNVDALFNAIVAGTQNGTSEKSAAWTANQSGNSLYALSGYKVLSVSSGSDALAAVSVTITGADGGQAIGRGYSEDTTLATGYAIMNAINELVKE